MTEAAKGTGHTWADSWKAPALLGVATAVAFLPALFGSFAFDDMRFIVDNPNVQRTESWLRLVTDAGTADPASPWGIVRPLRTVEFAVDRALFGAGPLGFHVHSLLWHVAAAMLLFYVLRRLLADSVAAFFASLLWAVHPSHVESVAWITSRGDLGMGACSLAAILFAMRSKGWDRDLAVSLGAAALAVLYKETGVVVPLAVAALRWTKFSRAPLWPYFVVAGLYVVYRRAVQVGDTGLNVAFVLGGGVEGTFATMIRAFGWYVAQSFLPSFSQDWYLTPSTSFADGAVVGWLAAHAALLVSAVAARRREPRWTLAVALFYGFLGPVANWPLSVSIPTAERFMYVPLAGFALALGLALVRAMSAGGTRPSGGGSRAGRKTCAAALVVAAAFAVTSAKRSTFWRDDPTLWSSIIADHESPRGREAIAEAIESDALALRETATRMPPGPEREKRETRVRELLEEALANSHQSLEDTYSFELVKRSNGVPAMRAEYNASNMCFQLGRHEEALFHAEEALAIREDVSAAPHYDRAWPLLRLGFPTHAMESMRRARTFKPDRPDPDIAGFFYQAASECERLGLHRGARAGFAAAVEIAGPGPVRDAARQRLDAAIARPLTADDDAREKATIARLDEKLAAQPRWCPVRRDHSVRK